jgi:hypothetical protein
MNRGYIYLISFNNTNDIYIGKTTQRNICFRLKDHRKSIDSSVNQYVKSRLNGDWSKVFIDVIDSIDMNEDSTHLISHPSNIFERNDSKARKYTGFYIKNEHLLRHKLAYTEYFHIHDYKNKGKYNLINKKITNGADVYHIYKFFNCTKTD